MKKLFALMLALTMICALVACGGNQGGTGEGGNETPTAQVMSYAEYVAADIDDAVVVEAYVQATQGWYHNSEKNKDVITVYAADADGAYFIYDMECSEADAEKLVPGAKIKVSGYKAEWSGEVEIVDATFEFVEGADPFVAEAKDLTDKLGTDDLVNYQNQLAIFKGMSVKGISYKNDQVGNDIYVSLTKDGKDYSFCVESYLMGIETVAYQSVMTLREGDVIDVYGYLYWYEGPNTHITKIDITTQHTMTYAEYNAAGLECKVTIDAYVQAHQSWWDNKITVYAADQDGAYFIYELACTEEQKASITPGAHIKVSGYKTQWGGEVEIVDASFEVVENSDSFIAETKDLTDKLGTEELIDYQNQHARFNGMTVVSIEFKNGEPGDDIYVNLTKDGAEYSFCIERYLTDPDTEVYKAVSALKAGDVIDVEGYVYWYNGINTHITKVEVK